MPFVLYINVLGRHFILQIYIVYDKNKKSIAGLAGTILMAIAVTLVIWVFYLPNGEAVLIFLIHYHDFHRSIRHGITSHIHPHWVPSC